MKLSLIMIHVGLRLKILFLRYEKISHTFLILITNIDLYLQIYYYYYCYYHHHYYYKS